MNFIILGEGRCGSNMLVSYLNQQKNIKCHGELFNGCKFAKKVMPCFAIEDDRDESKLTWNVPTDILERLRQASNKQYLGFKLHYYQANDLKKLHNFPIENYIKENDVKVIFADRKNSFLKNLSMQKAQANNCFYVTKKQLEREPNLITKNNIKIKFDIEKYWQSKQFTKRSRTFFREFFIKNNINFYEVYYEDLIGDNKIEHYRNIVRLIEGTDENFIELPDVETIKQNVYTVEEQVTNYNELTFFLKDDPWFEDAIK